MIAFGGSCRPAADLANTVSLTSFQSSMAVVGWNAALVRSTSKSPWVVKARSAATPLNEARSSLLMTDGSVVFGCPGACAWSVWRSK